MTTLRSVARRSTILMTFAGASLSAGLLLTTASARADMCFKGGGGQPPEGGGGNGQVDGGIDGGTAHNKRKAGAGILAAATLGTVWLSLRRREKKNG